MAIRALEDLLFGFNLIGGLDSNLEIYGGALWGGGGNKGNFDEEYWGKGTNHEPINLKLQINKKKKKNRQPQTRASEPKEIMKVTFGKPPKIRQFMKLKTAQMGGETTKTPPQHQHYRH